MYTNRYIVFIVREPVGGIWKHIEILMRFFKNNYKIIIISDLKNGDKKFQIFKKQNSDIEYLDISIRRKPSFSDINNIKIIKKYLENKQIDIIHGHGAKGGIYARILGLFFTSRIIYTPHGGSVHSSFGKVQTLFYKIIESMLYFLTDKVVVESGYTNIQYRKVLLFNTKKSKKIILNYNGIDCKIKHTNEIQVKFHQPIEISSFGMLRYEKGQDILILAVKKLIDRGINIKLNLYGEGENRKKYQELIKSNSMERNIFLHGETDQVELKMKESDIIIQPSRFESFGYVLLEAMCVGKSIISSDAGGMSEIMEHNKNGLIFKNENIDDLVKQIKYILNNSYKIKEYIQEGRKTIELKFSSQVMCENLNEIYENRIND